MLFKDIATLDCEIDSPKKNIRTRYPFEFDNPYRRYFEHKRNLTSGPSDRKTPL